MIYDFGKEDKSFVSSIDLKNTLKCHFRGIPKLVKLIYCNPNILSNNNINYIKNNEKELEIMENGVFRIVNKEYVLDSIILDLWTELNNYYEKLEKDGMLENFKTALVCNETWERITDFINTYNKFQNGEYVCIEDLRNEVLNVFKLYSIEKNKKKNKKSRRKSVS
jgi:hypothetical protein